MPHSHRPTETLTLIKEDREMRISGAEIHMAQKLTWTSQLLRYCLSLDECAEGGGRMAGNQLLSGLSSLASLMYNSLVPF